MGGAMRAGTERVGKVWGGTGRGKAVWGGTGWVHLVHDSSFVRRGKRSYVNTLKTKSHRGA